MPCAKLKVSASIWSKSRPRRIRRFAKSSRSESSATTFPNTRRTKEPSGAKLKEIKFRVNIDDHDYLTKIRHGEEFLDRGNKVRVQLQFRGREMAHQEFGMQLMEKVRDDLSGMSQVETEPKITGRNVTMTLSPAGEPPEKAICTAAENSRRAKFLFHRTGRNRKGAARLRLARKLRRFRGRWRRLRRTLDGWRALAGLLCFQPRPSGFCFCVLRIELSELSPYRPSNFYVALSFRRCNCDKDNSGLHSA